MDDLLCIPLLSQVIKENVAKNYSLKNLKVNRDKIQKFEHWLFLTPVKIICGREQKAKEKVKHSSKTGKLN